MHCLVSWQLIPRDNELVRLPRNFFSQNLHHAFCIAFGHWYNWKDDSSSKAAERKSRLLLLFIYSYSHKYIYLLLLELKGPLRFWYKSYLIHIQCWRSPRSFCSEWFCAMGRKRRLGLTEVRRSSREMRPKTRTWDSNCPVWETLHSFSFSTKITPGTFQEHEASLANQDSNQTQTLTWRERKWQSC